MAKQRQQPAAGQDEADIVTALGAEPVDPEDPTGPLVADEDAVRAAGAVDAESIRANNISTQTVNRKRGGEKNVTINEPLLQKYETITRLWPINSLSILVKRLTGTQIEWPITSQPKNAVELYAAIKALHGRHEEATYEVFIRDSQIKANRGTGRITMPDTRDEVPPQPQPGQSPMNPYYPQPYGAPQYSQPQATPPYAAPGYPQQQPPQQPPGQPAPQQPPAVVHVAPSDPSSMIATMQQMFQIFQQMQASAQPQQPQSQQPVMPAPPANNDPASMMAWMNQMFDMFRQVQASGQPQPQPQPTQPMMPPPPAGNDPASMMAWMQQMFSMFQQVQSSGQQPTSGRGAHQPQQQPVMNPMMMGGVPPVQPPPGMVFVPGWGMVSMEALAQAQAQAASACGGRPRPYGRRPPYYAGQGPGGGDPSQQPPYQGGQYPGGGGYPQQPGGYPPHPQQPPPPKSMADQFREATSVIRLATELADEFRPQAEPQAPAAPPAPEPDDSPIKVIDTGPAKIVINKDSGSARLWETLVTNSPGIFKWVGEQAEAIQKAANEREAAKRRSQQLPPGYVEVGPGYVPPPGYVAVPEMPPQQQHMLSAQPQQPPAQPPLPPPPAQMPPPITQQQQQPTALAQRRTWELPEVPR